MQDGLKQYDYGARLYDPVIGGWGSVDPLAENHHGFSPYAYVLNNPMAFIDPLGLDTIGVHNLDMSTYKEDVDVVQLNEASVTAYRSSGSGGRNYGGDGSGSFSDRFMYGLDGVNQYLPTTHVLNSISYAFTGRDIMGNNMSLGGATLGAVSVLPVGKVGGAAVKGIRQLAKTGTRGGLNLFKWGAPQTTKATGWKAEDYMLHLPNKGTPKLNWKANYGELRREMGLGKPIFDSYRLPDGNLIPTGGFLNAERSILQGRGWMYNPSNGAWMPPGL